MIGRSKRGISFLCALILLLLALPALGEIMPRSGPANFETMIPAGQNTINIKVMIQDKDDPEKFNPAERIWVSYQHQRVSIEVNGKFTDEQGRITLNEVPDGLSEIYLETDEINFPFGHGYQFPSGYIQDNQTTYVVMNNNNRTAELEFWIRLKPELAEGDKPTGGIRLQKAFYPYPVNDEFGPGDSMILMDMVTYCGTVVQGAEFIVYTKADYEDPDSPISYWNADGPGFTSVESDATKYASNSDGQVLIQGLPEGYHMLREVTPLSGCGIAFDGPDYGVEPDYPFHLSWKPFEVKADQIQKKQSPVINAPEAFSYNFYKIEAGTKDPPEGVPPDEYQPNFVNGAQFVVYWLNDAGDKIYQAYRNDPMPEQPLLPYFTTDEQQAYVFVSGMLHEGIVSIPGLLRYHPETKNEITYYLKEKAASPGYNLMAEDLAFSYENRVSWYENETIPFLENPRMSGSLLVQMHGDPEVVGSNYYCPIWLKYPPGAKFILFRYEDEDRVSLLTGYDESTGKANFSDSFDLPVPEGDIDAFWRNLVDQYKALEVETRAPSGAVAFTGLDSGDYLPVETVLPPGYERTGNAITEPRVTINEDQPFVTVHINNYMRQGTYIAFKTDTSGIKPLKGAEFVVYVRKIDESPYQEEEGFLSKPLQPGESPILTKTDPPPYRFVTDENGLLVITNLIDADNSYTYQYYLIEVQAPEGYLPETYNEYYGPGRRIPGSDNHDVIYNTGGQQVSFSLMAKKELKHGTLKEGQFTFNLYQRDEGHDDRLLATTTNDADGNIWFREVWITHRPGEETQLVIKEQVPDDQGNIIYDKDKECIQKAVFRINPRPVWPMPMKMQPRMSMRRFHNSNDFSLEFLGDPTYIRNGVKVPCVFINEVILDPVDVQIQVDKELIWSSPDQEGQPVLETGAYSFTLSRLDSTAPGPVNQNLGVSADGKVTVPSISFNREGSYRYLLKENLPGGVDPDHYDQRLIEVTVVVSAVKQPDGSFALEASQYFRDLSEETASEEAPVFVNKVKPPVKPVQATIQLTKKLEGAKLKAGQFQFELWQDGALLKEGISHDEKGNISIATPPLPAPGLYVYQIKEAPGNDEGYTYDTDTLYTVQVNIEEEEGSNLVVKDTKLFKNGRPYTGDLVFINRYASPSPAPTTTSPASTPTSTTEPSESPSPSPTPTTPPKPSAPPVVPSYPTLKVPLEARKVLQGGSLKAGMFTFQLKDASGKVLAEVSNDASGRIVFPDRTFSREVSNYRYTINEVAGADGKIIYDKTVYTVKVTTRAVNGRLEATVDIEKNGTPFAGNMVFTNRRQAPPTGDNSMMLLIALMSASVLLLGGAIALDQRRRKYKG